LRRTPEQIIETVRDEDAILLGLSSLSGAHGHLFPRICETLREHNMGDVIVFGGGIIPEDDRSPLFEAGVRAIFGPGTTSEEMVEFIATAVQRDDAGVGHGAGWYWNPSA
jgi:methylmalonyl-CoA mutase C-terminal domain/subunit